MLGSCVADKGKGGKFSGVLPGKDAIFTSLNFLVR
jgi:hypothetical protein